MKRSRIHWLRRALLKLATWGDPMFKRDWQDRNEAEAIVHRAMNGCLEDQCRLREGVYALKYLRGGEL